MKETRLLKPEGSYAPHPDYPGVELLTAVACPQDSPNLKTAYVRVQPGGEILPHTHPTVEVACMMSGSGEILINGQYRPFSAGDGFYAPAGVVHGLRNTGSEPVLIFANFPDIME